MLVYRGDRSRDGAAVRAPADRVPARGGPGHAVHAGAAAARRDQERTRGGAASRSSSTSSRPRRTRSSRCSRSPASASAARGQNSGLAFVRLKRWDERKRARSTASQAIAGRAIGGLRADQATRWSSRSRRRRSASSATSSGFESSCRIAAALGHDALMRRATSCSAWPRRIRALTQRAPQRPRGHAAVQDRRRPGEGRRARACRSRDINATLAAAWGGAYVNDFIDAAGSSASTCRPTRRSACSPRTSTAGTCATAAARWCRSRRSHRALDLRLARARALQRLPGDADPGPGGAGRSSGEAMAAMERLAAQLPGRHRLRMDRPVLRGAAVGRAGAAAVRAVDPGRVPVPRRAVRELVDPVRRCMLVVPLGVARRAARGHAAAAWPTTCTSRSAC